MVKVLAVLKLGPTTLFTLAKFGQLTVAPSCRGKRRGQQVGIYRNRKFDGVDVDVAGRDGKFGENLALDSE